MKWRRFRLHGANAISLLDGEHVQVHDGDMFSEPRAPGERVSVGEVEWLAPCQPSKLIGLWNNFRATALTNGRAQPAEPLYFLKAPSSLSAHETTIGVPVGCNGRVA